MIIHCELLIKNKNKKPLRQNKNTVALCKKWFYHKGKDTILVSWSMPFPNQTPTESICHMFNSLSLNLYWDKNAIILNHIQLNFARYGQWILTNSCTFIS